MGIKNRSSSGGNTATKDGSEGKIYDSLPEVQQLSNARSSAEVAKEMEPRSNHTGSKYRVESRNVIMGCKVFQLQFII